MPKVVIYGAGGMGKEVAETVLAAASCQSFDLLGFLDENATVHGSTMLGYPVLGDMEWISKYPEVQVAIGIGQTWARYLTVQRFQQLGAQFATIIDPRAHISPTASIGEGSIIVAACTVSAGAWLGRFTYLNFQAQISHDAIIEDHACIMGQTAISGNVRVGEGVFFGVGACTRQGVSIGKWSIIGAGAAVVEDIPPLCVAVGVPAKPIKKYNEPKDMPSF